MPKSNDALKMLGLLKRKPTQKPTGAAPKVKLEDLVIADMTTTKRECEGCKLHYDTTLKECPKCGGVRGHTVKRIYPHAKH